MEYRQCTRCVMDTSDKNIQFNEQGFCNHCVGFFENTVNNWFPNADGEARLKKMLEKIRIEGASSEYDCIIGLSGGVDSSYLALKAKNWGLRPLVVHVDAGWNSELAVFNIENIIKYCKFDLHTHVVDWREMRELHLAYLASGIANQDVPQDHIFMATLYHFAVKNKIKYILSGGNTATESIFPSSWHGSAMDSVNLKYIFKQYGKKIKLRQYKTIGFFEYFILYPFIKKMRTFRPLDYMPYNKEDAIAELENTCGWRSYDRKHGESFFTKFFQNYYLPTRFGFDKRRPHLSSLIVSGQISREDALNELNSPLYSNTELEFDKNYICKKLKISRQDLDVYMTLEKNYYENMKNWNKYYLLIKKIQKIIQGISGRRVNIYS